MKHIVYFIIFIIMQQLNASDFFSNKFADNVWPSKLSNKKTSYIFLPSSGTSTGIKAIDKQGKEVFLLFDDLKKKDKYKNYFDNSGNWRLPVINFKSRFIKALDIPVDANIPSKEGIEISSFKNFYGIRDFPVIKKLNQSNKIMSFIIVDEHFTKYYIQILPFDSCQKAWNDFISKSEHTTISSNAYPMFQKTSFNGIYAVKTFSPPGIHYTISAGPYFVSISAIRQTSLSKLEKLSDNVSISDWFNKFQKHEKNFKKIVTELNLLLEKKNDLLPPKSPLFIDILRKNKQHKRD